MRYWMGVRAVVVVVGLLGGCLTVEHNPCGDLYCGAGYVCAPDQTRCVVPAQLDACIDPLTGLALPDGRFCMYDSVPTGQCQASVCVSEVGTLPKPTGLVASDGDSSDHVTLTWDPVQGATGYRIWRDNTALIEVMAPAFDDTSAASGPAPPAPGATVASQGTYLEQVELGWSAAVPTNGAPHVYAVSAIAEGKESARSDNESGHRGAYPITGYQVSLDGGTFTDIGQVLAYSDTTALIGTFDTTVIATDTTAGRVGLSLSTITPVPSPRTYRVRAVSGAGAGDASMVSGYRQVGTVVGYQWQRADASGGPYSDLAGATVTPYNDTTGPVGDVRWYRCLLTGTNGESSVATVDSGLRYPEAPTNFTASDGTSPDHVALSWDPVFGATGYRVTRSGSTPATFDVDASTTTYLDTDATPGSVPSAPTLLDATDGDFTDRVEITWGPPTNTGSSATAVNYSVRALAGATISGTSGSNLGHRGAYPLSHYEVELTLGAGYFSVGNVLAYTDTTAPPGSWTSNAIASDTLPGRIALSISSPSNTSTSRNYRVRAVNGAGPSSSASNSGHRSAGAPTTFQWQWSDSQTGTYADVPGGTTQNFDDTTVPAAVVRWYRCLLSNPTSMATATTSSNDGFRIADVPTNFTASDGTSTDHVTLTWDPVPGATAYRVFRGATQIMPDLGTGVCAATCTYLDTGAPAPGAPGTVGGLLATDGTQTDRVDLTWNPVTPPNGASSSYTVRAVIGASLGAPSVADAGYRAAFPVTYELQIDGGSWSAIGAATGYADTAALAGTFNPTVSASEGLVGRVTLDVTANPVNGTTRSYSVRAVNTAGMGNPSTANTGYRGVGAPSFQWQRSAGPSDSGHANIAGATTDPYDDTASIPVFEARYYRVVITAAGVTPVTSASNSGWRGVTDTAGTNTWIAGGRITTGVNAVVAGTGVVYLGGDFTYVGPHTGTVPAADATGTGPAIASWPRFTGFGRAAVPDGAGGWYLSIGSSVVRVTAAGSVDATFNPGPIGTIEALALSGGVLYIGGTFTTVGGQGRVNIAALDATTGAPTAWNPGATGGAVNALAVGGGRVFAGGAFATLGGSLRNRLGSVTTAGVLDAWNPSSTTTITDLVIAGTTVYVICGNATTIGGQTRNYLAAIDTGTGAATAWNPNPSGGTAIRGIAIGGSGDVFVGGFYTSIGGASRGGLAALNPTTGIATSWDPGGISNVYAIAISGTTIYVGGGFTSAGGQTRYSLAAFDTGTAALRPWNPNANDWVDQFIATDGTKVIVGGGLEIISVGGVPRNNLAALDVATGVATSWNPNAGGSVETLRLVGTTLYAGGSFTTMGGTTRNRAAAVDANSGALLAWNPNADGTVRTLVESAGTIYAGGDFANIGGQPRNKLAALDASGAALAWNPIADATVRAIAVNGSTVYAGGDFTFIGGQPRARIAALAASGQALAGWDPNPVATFNTPSVRTMLLHGSTLFVGGNFNTIGGQSRAYLAALDPATGLATSWAGSSGDVVDGIAISGSALYYCNLDITAGVPTVRARDVVTAAAATWQVELSLFPACDVMITGAGRLYVGGGHTHGVSSFDP